MSTHAQAQFKVESWEENTYEELGGEAKLTRASVGQAFTGDLEGGGSVEWLMCYREDKTADFVGLQRFVGRIGSRSGSFVMQTRGSFDGTEAKGRLDVVAGSGTEELSAITGTGAFAAPLGSTASVELDYDLQ
ncbi:MAG TPA: DUF3224 domain-containing protein [Solirubrobacteraceae bacterium]|jgi:Protein of unknown function (DUF3224)|nr:DUF3224 domain-containing protein [Solirubrobacteraceae bacterium]